MKRLTMLAFATVLAACDSGAKTPAPSTPAPLPTVTATSPSTSASSTPAPLPTVTATSPSTSASSTPHATPSTTSQPTPSATTSNGGRNDPKAAADPETCISGAVRFTGEKIPKRPKAPISGVPECGSQYKEDEPLLDDKLVISEAKMIKNVIVWVKSGLEGRTFPPAAGKTTIHQKGCHYEPHVLVVQKGQSVEVVNDDSGVVHNVHLLPKINPAVPENKGQQPGASDAWPMAIPEAPFFIKCDIHPWMGSWCGVSDHPYFAVTGADGAFELKGLPPGEYVVEAWHEKYGARALTVKVGAKEKAKADFAYDGK